MAEFPLDLEKLRKEIEDRMEGRELLPLDDPLPLNSGKSGAKIWRLSLKFVDGHFGMAVLKLSGKKSDGYDECAGWEAFSRGGWPAVLSCSRPQLLGAFEADPACVERAVVYSSFVDQKSTEIDTLARLLPEDCTVGRSHLRQLYQTYHDRMRQFAHGEAKTARDHFRSLIVPALLQKMESDAHVKWANCGVETDKKFVAVFNRNFPNTIYALRNEGFWSQDRFDLPYLPIHGDLNDDNVMILSDGGLTFVDFEKTRVSTPHYDLAFLFMWLVRHLFLDRLPAYSVALESRLPRLAVILAECFRRETFDNVPCEMLVLSPAVEELLIPLKRLGTAQSLVETKRKGARLALSIAALVRSYYEFRDGGKNGGDIRFDQLCGKFFYAFSACMLDDERLITLKSYDDVFPLSNPSMATGPAAPAVYREQALKLRIGCDARPGKAFSTRLVYTASAAPSAFDEDPPGWKRFTEVEPYRYFSLLRITANSDFYNATKNLLVWRPIDTGEPAPLVYELNAGSLLQGQTLCKFGELSLNLGKVDLIPVYGGRSAMIGLWFDGSGCGLKDYLRWISERVFGRHRLIENSKEPKRIVTIHGLVSELTAAIREGRDPDINRMNISSAGEKPAICQYLLAPEDERWLPGSPGPDLDLGMQMLSSFSRLNANYPKPPWPRIWTDPRYKDTFFGIHRMGITAWASAADQFNYESKRNIFLESLYLQWIIARELTSNPTALEELRRAVLTPEWRGTPRESFVETCHSFFEAK
jgi:hypothetical protein